MNKKVRQVLKKHRKKAKKAKEKIKQDKLNSGNLFEQRPDTQNT
jgi:hypothetical protein